MLSITSEPLTQPRLLYDGMCPLCRRSVAVLQKLDWLRTIDYRSAREPANVPATDPPLEPARLLEEMHLVTTQDHVYHGFGAFRWMAWRLPLLWLVAPFLYVPGVPWIGQKIYLWIARNRFQLVPCKDGVCTVPPREQSKAG
jgi:predicted DCC family thiol-disulfide oxidoreductase YuxK